MDIEQYFPARRIVAILALLVAFCTSTPAQGIIPAVKSTDNNSKPAGEPAAASRGRVVYHDRCAICHFSDSEAMKIGPGLKGIYKRGKYWGGGKVDDAPMERWIVNGGKDMPPFKTALSTSQIRDLIAYLKTL